jgi:hypothetical protein
MAEITEVGVDSVVGDQQLMFAFNNLLLDRKPDPTGYRDYLDMLRAGTLSRSSLIGRFLSRNNLSEDTLG